MTLPTHSFAPIEVKPRTGEPYLTSAVNKKFLGWPRGVHLGFIPQVTNGSLIVTLAIDPTYGLSLARVKSSLEASNIDVVSDQPLTLDFTGHDFVTNPTAYVKVQASAQLGSPTTAQVYTTATAGSTPTDQLICVVTKPGANLVAAFDAPTHRATPYAYSGTPLGYGFMGDGAVEQLLQAVAMVAEVAAARVDLAGVNHPYAPISQKGLTDRITADLQPAAIAGRLGLTHRVIRSQDYTLGAPAATINVSSSFARTGRTRPPLVTIVPNGSETLAGAITDADVRNVCFILLIGTNERPLEASTRAVAYGRLVTSIQVLAGTVTFNGTTSVTGSGTAFLDPSTGVNAGDIILAPNGDYYVVATTPGSNTSLTLTTSAPAGTITSTRRRFNLNVVKRNPADNTEVPFTIGSGSIVRFFFGAWFDLSASVHDSTLLMFEGGEEAPLPDATVATKGKAIMYPGVAGALCGAMSILDTGGVVGSGKPCYSLNFKGAALNPAPGIANITASGPIGPIGLPGTGPGPPGVTGPPGLGFNSFSAPFVAGPYLPSPGGGWALGQVITHDVTFAGKLKYLHGGIAAWATPGPYADGNDNFAITAVAITNPTGAGDHGRVTNTISSVFDAGGPPTLDIQLFLNGAG